MNMDGYELMLEDNFTVIKARQEFDRLKHNRLPMPSLARQLKKKIQRQLLNLFDWTADLLYHWSFSIRYFKFKD